MKPRTLSCRRTTARGFRALGPLPAIVVAAHAGLVGSYLLLAPPPERGLAARAIRNHRARAAAGRADFSGRSGAGPGNGEVASADAAAASTEPGEGRANALHSGAGRGHVAAAGGEAGREEQVEEPEAKNPTPRRPRQMAPAPVTTANPRSDQQVAPVARAPARQRREQCRHPELAEPDGGAAAAGETLSRQRRSKA